jgi:hypothetical protein
MMNQMILKMLKGSQIPMYELLAQCIRSDQLTAAQVWEEFLNDPEFYIWYKEKYGLFE